MLIAAYYTQPDMLVVSMPSAVVMLDVYGVVLKGLLTFLGSLYKEDAKTTSGTLVYRFERQTAKKKKRNFFLPNTLCPQLRM